MPAKAKLVTRTSTSSSVSSDNLGKGTELTFAELDGNLINLRDQTIGIVGDDSSGIDVQSGETIKIAGGTNITTAVTGDTVTITNSFNTGDITFSGNTISTGSSNANLELAAAGTGQINLLENTDVTGNLETSGYLANPTIRIEQNQIKTTQSNADLELDTSGTGRIKFNSNLAATTIQSSVGEPATLLKILDVDTDASAGPIFELFRSSTSGSDADLIGQIKFRGLSNGGNEREYVNITGKIVDARNGLEDSALLFNLFNNGSDTHVATLGHENLELLNGVGLTTNGTISTDGVSIVDNEITASRSNDNLNLTASGTGLIQLGAGTDGTSAGSHNVGTLQIHEASTSGSTRLFANGRTLEVALTGDTSSSNSRYRIQDTISLDMAGFDSTSGGTTKGAQMQHLVELKNSASGNSQLASSSGQATGLFITAGGSGDLTLDDFYSIRSFGLASGSVAGTTTVTDYYHFYSDAFNTGSSGNVTVSNEYAFYDNGNKLSRFGAVILANQSGDPSGVTDSSHIYAKDDGGSSEVHVRDEAGNVTKISPHNEQGEWEFYSKNTRTGKTVRINMEKAIKVLEKISGETLIEQE